MNISISRFSRYSNLILQAFKSPLLVYFLVLGNTVMFSIATTFYAIEKDYNPQLNEVMDAIWWGFTTVTTVGYGDIVPVTFTGRILGIILMVLGTIFFVGFTAIFVSVLTSLHTDLLIKQEEKLTIKEYRHLLAAIEKIDEKISKLEK